MRGQQDDGLIACIACFACFTCLVVTSSTTTATALRVGVNNANPEQVILCDTMALQHAYAEARTPTLTAQHHKQNPARKWIWQMSQMLLSLC